MISIALTVELIIIAAMLVICRFIVRKSFATNLIGVVIRGTGVVISGLVASIAFQLIRLYGGSLPVSAIASATISSLVFIPIYLFAQRQSKTREWGEQLTNSMGLSAFWDRSLTCSIVIGLWLGVLLVASLFGDILTISPEGREVVRETIVLEQLVNLEEESVYRRHSDYRSAGGTIQKQLVKDDRQTRIRDAAADQANFFKRFSSGVQSTKQQVYSATGLDGFHHEIELVRSIVNLSSEDKLWLIEENEQLQSLVEHPVILRIVENDELVARFDRFAAGAVNEILVIGMNPDINLLLEDKEFAKQIQKIDLEQLLRQCEQRKKGPSIEPR